MKKLLLFISTWVLFPSMYSQQISSITISPANPLTTDTIKLYVTCDFPSSGCNGTANFIVNGNTVSGSALHCMGMLSALCTDVDTIKLNPPHAAGSYSFYFTLDAGYQPSCTPGIISDDTDTLFYTVSVPTGAAHKMKQDHFLISPNPTKGIVNLSVKENLQGTLKIINVIGKEVFKSVSPEIFPEKIDLTGNSAGIYFLIYEGPEGKWTRKIVLEK
jgi:hypothetical protein